MPIQIPSNFVEICSYSINSASDRYTKEGKILKSAFRIGSSDSVKSSGKVIIDTNDAVMATDDITTPEEQNSSDTADNSKDNESYHYTLLEACTNLHIRSINEADDEQDTAKQSANVPKFEPGQDLYVQVLLPGEGCSIWHIQIDRRSSVHAVKKALQSKNFSAAFNIAGKSTESDGLVPLSVKTYMNKNAKCKCPFIGHCRYAFDSGTEKLSEESNTVCLAVAPIDPRTNKPDEETVFKAVYNIVGDISGGVINSLTKLVNKGSGDRLSSRDEDTDEEGISDEVSKFLNKKFKCVGDSTMYANFVKIRNFIEKQLSENNLEYNDSESESVTRYSKLTTFTGSKTFIYY